MATVPTDFLEALDFFETCFICQSYFNSTNRKPLALFCGHTFCSSCVPNFKKVFGQLNCPIDHINEVRPPAAIPVNALVKSYAEYFEVRCLFHPENSADYYNVDDVEPFCEVCRPRFQRKTVKEIKDLNPLNEFLNNYIAAISSQPGIAQRCAGFPNVQRLLQNLLGLSNSERQRLLFNLQNIASNKTPDAPRELPPLPEPPKPVFTHYRPQPDGSWEIDRFNRIVPQNASGESKQWWLSNPKQVDALIVMVNRPISLLGIGLGKEVAPSPTAKIDYVVFMRGSSTQGTVLSTEFANTPYSGDDPQIQKLIFSKPQNINPGDKLIVKAKQSGRGLYYGDPAARNDPLIGPDDLIFTFDDPTYAGGDYQNGQNKWAGPIVRLYFKFR